MVKLTSEEQAKLHKESMLAELQNIWIALDRLSKRIKDTGDKINDHIKDGK